ncbi:hypothetical protein ES703_86060 [subsurface metagenome]
MAKSELRAKSVRMDNLSGAGTANYHIWKWSPQRDIKIYKVFMCLDMPDAQSGTVWAWLSKGAVDMDNPADEPNEEEMIFALQHLTSDSTTPNNVRAFFDFEPHYIEIEDGETVVLTTRQPATNNMGIGLIIYYTP